MNGDELPVTLSGVAQALNLSLAEVTAKVDAGEFASVERGGGRFVLKSELDRLIGIYAPEKLKKHPGAPAGHQARIPAALRRWLDDVKAAASGASEEAIQQAERSLDVRFPPDYLELMRAVNGYEGSTGATWLRLWPIEELVSRNQEQEASRCAPEFVVFGSNGGGETFAFVGTAGSAIVQVPDETLDRQTERVEVDIILEE